jgi:hypothetical protein
VNALMNLQIQWNAVILSSGYATVGLSSSAQLQRVSLVMWMVSIFFGKFIHRSSSKILHNFINFNLLNWTKTMYSNIIFSILLHVTFTVLVIIRVSHATQFVKSTKS